MQHPKVSHPERQFLVRPRLILKHQAVPRTVHRLQPKCFRAFVLAATMILDQEEVLFVVLVVTRHLPQVDVVQVRRYHLLEPALLVLLPHQIY